MKIKIKTLSAFQFNLSVLKITERHLLLKISTSRLSFKSARFENPMFPCSGRSRVILKVKHNDNTFRYINERDLR